MPKHEPTIGKEYAVVPPRHGQRGRAFNNGIFIGGVLVVTMILVGLGSVWIPFQSANHDRAELDSVLDVLLPSGRPPLEPATDCGYEAFAYIWQDHNQNGIWDKGERPLRGVPLLLGGVDRDDVRSETVLSEPDGITELHGWSGGCPPVRLKVSATVPSGFWATTSLIQSSNSSESMDAYFGFTDGPLLPVD